MIESGTRDNPKIILRCAAARVAMAVNAWYDFELDPSVPLWEDDRQNVLRRFG